MILYVKDFKLRDTVTLAVSINVAVVLGLEYTGLGVMLYLGPLHISLSK